ncbi:MAG: hypothetical protein ABI145_20770 [Steroidobacteraceae bacterium]
MTEPRPIDAPPGFIMSADILFGAVAPCFGEFRIFEEVLGRAPFALGQ